ncbi:MAG: hypothetical protein ABTA16_00715 [Niallia sp.]
MRIVSIEAEYMKPQLVKGFITKEDVLTENKDSILKFIEVSIGQFDADQYKVAEDKYTIDGEKYELLMSESPDFAPGKPKDDYRKEDLYYIIDLIRAERKALLGT